MYPYHIKVTILGETRCVFLHYDSSKHYTFPLNKFVYAFKVVKLFLKQPAYLESDCLICCHGGPEAMRVTGQVGLYYVVAFRALYATSPRSRDARSVAYLPPYAPGWRVANMIPLLHLYFMLKQPECAGRESEVKSTFCEYWHNVSPKLILKNRLETFC
jgi:hypothetical protein